jgi:hypothetical protein
MVIELGEACTALNDAQDLHANLEIKAKGLLALIFWPGNFNAIAGQVRHGPTGLGEVSGWWSALMATKVPPPLYHHSTHNSDRQDRSARYLTCRSTVAL